MRRWFWILVLVGLPEAAQAKELTRTQLMVRLELGPPVHPSELAVRDRASVLLGFGPEVPRLSPRHRHQIQLRRAPALVRSDPWGAWKLGREIAETAVRGSRTKRLADRLVRRANGLLSHWTADDRVASVHLDLAEASGSLTAATQHLGDAPPMAPEVRRRAERLAQAAISTQLDKHVRLYDDPGHRSLYAPRVLRELAWLMTSSADLGRREFATWATAHPDRLDPALRARLEAVAERLRTDARSDVVLQALLDGRYDPK